MPLFQITVTHHELPGAAVSAAFSAAILASIFRLAARIISSRRLCSSDCLSSLFVLHFLAAAACSAASASESCCTLSCRLYRCIRFGCAGFSVGRADEACVAKDEGEATLEPGGGGGWKVMGGCEPRGHVSHMSVLLAASPPTPLLD